MYTYKIKILSVYDGDTVTGMVDLGFNTFQKIKVRLARIDTPEIRTKDLEEKARGYEARDFLRQLVEKYKDDIIIITSGKGKYGRWIGDIYINKDNCAYDEDLSKYYDEIAGSCSDVGCCCINDILVIEKLAEYREY